MLFSEWKAEKIELDDTFLETALPVDKDEISSEQQIARTLHKQPQVAWQDLGLESLYNPR